MQMLARDDKLQTKQPSSNLTTTISFALYVFIHCSTELFTFIKNKFN